MAPGEEIWTEPESPVADPDVSMPPETVTEVPLRTRLPPGRAAPLPAVRLMPLPMLIWPLDWIASERPAVQPLSFEGGT